jgi:RNA-binding protein
MNNLSSSDRSFLRSQAHHLEPVVLIGKNGISDGTVEAVNKALEARELIKIKFREFKDNKQSISDEIAASANCHVVGMIGHTVILYRQNSDPEKQNICLPGIK